MASTRTSKTAGEMNADADTPTGDVAVSATTSVDGDESTTETPAEVPTMAELTGIRYVGSADVRGLTAADLESLGAESPKGDLTWSADNDKLVPASEINASTRDALLTLPEEFVAE